MDLAMDKRSDSILGISFDGLAISGIVNEFLNSADILRQLGLRVLFDPGYDITFRRDLDPQPLPCWVNELRVLGDKLPSAYCPEILTEATSKVTGGTTIVDCKVYDNLCADLSNLILNTRLRENVRYLLVENGTLPDNPIFTDSLYNAILEYGAIKSFGKYVLWRDYDLMWSAEPHLYGPYPYSGVRRPTSNRYIQYAVLTEWMKRRMQAWAPRVDYQVIPNRFYLQELRKKDRSLHASYPIPEHEYLVARCTRVIPQKCIERDLRLFDQI